MNYNLEYVRTELLDGTTLESVLDMPVITPAELAASDLSAEAAVRDNALPYVARSLGAHVSPEFYDTLNDRLGDLTGSKVTSGVAISIARLSKGDVSADFVHTGSEFFRVEDQSFCIGQLVSASNHIASADNRPNMSNIAKIPAEDRVAISGRILHEVLNRSISGGVAIWEAPKPPRSESVSGKVLSAAGAVALGNYSFKRDGESRNFIITGFANEVSTEGMSDFRDVAGRYVEMQAERSMPLRAEDKSVRANALVERDRGRQTIIGEVASVSISDYIAAVGHRVGMR